MCEPTVVSKLSNLDSATTTVPDLSDNIGKKIEDTVAKALQQVFKIVLQSTKSIKSTLDSLQQSSSTDRAHNKEIPVSQPASRSSTAADGCVKVLTVMYIPKNAIRDCVRLG